MPLGWGDTKKKDKVTDSNSIFMHSAEIGPWFLCLLYQQDPLWGQKPENCTLEGIVCT